MILARTRFLTVAILVAAFLVAAIGLVPAGLPGAAPSVVAASGLTTTADARYVVDPAAHRVHVSVALSATNHLKDTKTHRYYFDRSFMAVPPGATGFRISSGGAAPKVAATSRRPTYTLLRIDFGKQLAAGATRIFNLTFDLPDPGGAPTRATRIGTSLVTFSAWGLGSDGATGGSVTVVFPAGFTVDVSAAGLSGPRPDTAGNLVFSTGRLANPLTFVAAFAADRPSAFTETTLSIPIAGKPVAVTIRAWPDDPAWAKRVGGLLTRGLPALADAIGLPWTIDGPLIVQEAVSRSSTGFSGRYDPTTGTIQVAYYADPFVVLHEAAHAWFDGRLLADRWATEGFSSFYAIQAAGAIGLKGVTGDVLTPALEKVRIPLNSWGGPAADGSTTSVDDAELATALRVATDTAKLAGPDGLRAVWRAIADGRAAYQPVGPSAALERSTDAPDWRGLVDLFAEQASVDVTPIWSSWVVRPADAALLADRAGTRSTYAAVVARAGSWQLPRVVRDALRVWQFGQAGELLASATRALDARDAVDAAATAAGLTRPSTMQTDFEGPRGFAGATAEADAELAAIAAYRDAAAARPADAGVLARVGLWNSDPDALLAQAGAAFGAGNLQTTVSDAALARAMWTGADGVGRNRILAVGGLLAALLLGSWLVVRWYRDRGARRVARPAEADRPLGS
ncbi:MAG TPA: hypothetical protein VFP22_11970 [Candidatus Limnocylindrales bacterium]|nr:hypothetical protein [Candidatus Limnocylindrales bacterium]